MEPKPINDMTDEDWEAPLDEETEAQIAAAVANSRDYYAYEVAREVRYLASEDLLLLVTKAGQRAAIPVEHIQGLSNASRDAVANYELWGSGSCLHWEQLDVDFRVEDLVDGLYGSELWMKQLHEKRKTDAVAALSQTA